MSATRTQTTTQTQPQPQTQTQTLPPLHPYKYLTPEDVDHFLTHKWLKVPNAINPKILDEWLADLWTRTGYDEHDKSTWDMEYLHTPFHRQVRLEDFYPEAFNKIAEMVGGEDKMHPERERWAGDNFVINFGSEARSKSVEKSPKEKLGWHADNDWFRQFLDSSGTALTILNCFTDIPERGGGTWLVEDGMEGGLKYMYERPEGFDPVDGQLNLFSHLKHCKKYVRLTAKKGDIFIVHGVLPHSSSWNYLHYARVITNVHITLQDPLNLNRPDGNYSLVEQVVLNGLGRESIPEYKPTRERMFWYPRNSPMRYKQIPGELERLIKAAKAKGLDESAVDSIWLKSEEEQELCHRRNGMLLPKNLEAGFETVQHPI